MLLEMETLSALGGGDASSLPPLAPGAVPPAGRRTDPERPDPDALLSRLAEEEPGGRGRLTIFLGAAAGVGKTYAMLEAAHQRLSEGADVVAGWVETHGRPETEALLRGIPAIPPRIVPYRGTTLKEMDLDALLERHPALALVDELAHTNAPGSRHARRYQDVQELLAAGISVYTTLNIQHIESLNDVVAQITGVVVRETVPDDILDEADQIELVDLPPEELIQRLKEGKVYVPEQAEQALRHFFRPGNLNALRELALRRTAARVDRQLQAYMHRHEIAGPWPAGERVLVCVGSGPLSAQLVRTARRMAAALQAEWLAVYVENPQVELKEEDRDRIASTLRLAEELGAETITLQGEDVAQEILHLARVRNVTQILIGKPEKPRWKELIHGSPVDRIIRESGPISVHIVKGEGWPRAPEARPGAAPTGLGAAGRVGGTVAGPGLCSEQRDVLGGGQPWRETPIPASSAARSLGYAAASPAAAATEADRQVGGRTGSGQPLVSGQTRRLGWQPWLAYLAALGLVGVVTVIGHLFRSSADPANLALAYLLPVIWSAVRWGRGPAIAASAAGMLAFDFFFIVPYHRLAVAETRYLFGLMVFLGVGLLISTLASRLRRQVAAARRREERMASLYALSREVAALSGLEQVAAAVVRRLSEAIDGETILILPDERGELRVYARAGSDDNVPGEDQRYQGDQGSREEDVLGEDRSPAPLATPFDDNERAVATWVYRHGEAAGLDTETLSAAEFLYLPMKTARGVVGVLGVRPYSARRAARSSGVVGAGTAMGYWPRGRAGRMFMPDQRRLLDALVDLAAAAVERVQLAEQARQAQVVAESDRLRAALLNSVSHGLRTPLAAVIGAVTTLLDDEGLYDQEARHELLETIREESLRMNRLVGNLLDMARLESAPLHLNLSACDIDDVVGAAAARLADALRSHPLHVELPENLPPVRADFVLLEQVLVNILDNAAKYTPPGTPVRVYGYVSTGSQPGPSWSTQDVRPGRRGGHEVAGAKETGGAGGMGGETTPPGRPVSWVEVRVEDRGPGIPPEDLERIFNKFYRLKRPGQVVGTGLGLSICKAIIEAHGGRIWAENVPEGGTAICFRLPAADESEGGAPAGRTGGNSAR
ncbi:MAG: sensor histidine kinase KdpD [Limnochordaceae bacterium]|nr:sensor histidine kinase KdpD [Limnochordaceae bacterium]